VGDLQQPGQVIDRSPQPTPPAPGRSVPAAGRSQLTRPGLRLAQRPAGIGQQPLRLTAACLSSARSIPTIAWLNGSNSRSLASRAFRLRSPRDKPLRSLTDVLLDALGYQARQPHQEDVFTSSTDAQEELLVRCPHTFAGFLAGVDLGIGPSLTR
jgi:hypothetical protein